MAVKAMTSLAGPNIGILGVKALGLFVLFLLGGAAMMNLAGPPLLALYQPEPATVAALRESMSMPGVNRTAAAPVSMGGWLHSVLPSNLLRAAAEGQILPVLVFSMALGVALRRLPGERGRSAIEVFHALADAMLTMVWWIVAASPVAVFVLAFAMTQRAGDRLASFFGVFLLFTCGTMAAAILLLYPITSIFGRIGIGEFARASAPSQLVAVTTRSSLASLPAMMQGVESLRLNPEAAGFVLPFSASVFKLNRPFTATAKVLFVAHVLGIDLTPATMMTFTVTVILLSFAGAGIPSGGLPNLPAYLAAGIPIEAIIVLEAVDWIPDVFMTLLNVTGHMSVTALLGSRRATEVVIMEPAA
jgi:Na+/H+-dicarboxylate symporter